MPVHYAREGAAAVLTIDRPERRNAVDGETAAALLDGFEARLGREVLREGGGGRGALRGGRRTRRLYLTPMRSTTKTSVSSGPMTPPAPRLP